jgi:hypothetical protein
MEKLVGITWHELWIAGVLALVFAVIADLMRIGSRLRDGARRFKNRLSEYSAGNILKRIKVLEREKNRYLSYVASEKALYLYTFRTLMGILALMSGSGFLIGIREMLLMNAETAEFGRLMTIYVMMLFFSAFMFAVGGMKVTSWDTSDKIMVQVGKLDKEIEKLQDKLPDANV